MRNTGVNGANRMINQSVSDDTGNQAAGNRMDRLESFSVFHVRHDDPHYVVVDILAAANEYLADIAAQQLFSDSTIIRVEKNLTADEDISVHDVNAVYPSARFINGEFRMATFSDENMPENDK